MKTTYLGCGLLICFILLVPMAGWCQVTELSLDSLITMTLRVNPDLKAAEHRYRAFEAQVPQAGSLPNPMFQTSISNISTHSWSLGNAPMSGYEFMLSQTIPFPGKLGLAKNRTENLAQKSKEDYEYSRNFIISQLKQNYHQLCFLEKSIEITQENKLLLEDIAKIASTKYSVGEGIQGDVLRAQVELSQMINQIISLEEMRRVTRAKINILLNQNPQDSLGKPGELIFQKMSCSEEELQEAAVENNPQLKGMEFMVNASSADYKMARREYWPDLSLSFSYMRMKNNSSMDPVEGRDFISGSVGVELPLYFWSKQKQKVHQKSLELKFSQQEYEGMKASLKFGVSQLFYSLNRFEKEIDLYRTAILPQARQSLESAQSGYQVGKIDFLTFLESQITFYQYQIAFHQSLSSYQQTLAQLEEMVGGSLLQKGE